MASPTFGAAGTYLTGASSNQYNFPVPAGTANNEIVLIFLYLESTGAITTVPTGFTLKTRVTVGGAEANDLLVYWKRCTTTDAGTYDFIGPNTWRAGAACRFSGCITSGDPFNVINSNQTTSATSGVTAAVINTTTVTDTLQVWCGSNFNGGAWTPPSGYTEHVDTGNCELSVASLAQVSITSSGSITGTSSTGSAHASCSFLGALKSTTSSNNIPFLDQSHYRWGLDDGTESTHTFSDAEDTAASGLAVGDNRLLRIQVDEIDNAATNLRSMLQYRRSDEPSTEWRKVIS